MAAAGASEGWRSVTKAVESVAWLSLLRREKKGNSDSARAGTVDTSTTTTSSTLHRLSPARLSRAAVERKLGGLRQRPTWQLTSHQLSSFYAPIDSVSTEKTTERLSTDNFSL